jgi:hypothetical protein
VRIKSTRTIDKKNQNNVVILPLPASMDAASTTYLKSTQHKIQEEQTVTNPMRIIIDTCRSSGEGRKREWVGICNILWDTIRLFPCDLQFTPMRTYQKG